MPQPLDARIAAAMSPGARLTTVAELIEEVTSEIVSVEAEHGRLDELSKSAVSTEAEADAAADDAVKLSRKIVRLTAKRDQLRQRRGEMFESERRKVAEAAWSAAKVERDQLAADLALRWPELQAEMISLLARLKASDANCEAVNRNRAYGLGVLVSAEVEARGCTGLYQHPTLPGLPMGALKDLRLPHFHTADVGISDTLAWPPAERSIAADNISFCAQMETAHRTRAGG